MGQRKGWMVMVGVGCLAAAAFVGCSAGGDGSDISAALEPTEPDMGNTAPLPPSTAQAPTDAGAPAKDAGKKANPPKPAPVVDAGPPPPAPGTACTTANQVFDRICGKCGTQQALCQGGKVSDYGPCEGEAGECTAGTTKTEACGNCGTQTVSCDNTCSWTATACAGEPANACTPGGVDLITAGCATSNTFTSRSCSEACTWGDYSASCSAPPTSIRVAPTVGSANSTYAILKASQVMPTMSYGTCPSGSISTYTLTAPYQYLTIRNPLTKAAKVTITTAPAPNAASISTVLATYDGIVSPTDATSRKACRDGASTYGNKLAGVTIPANTTISLYVSASSNYDAAKPTSTTGRLQVTVTTDEIP
jgi:hypothetical protein